MIHGGTHPEKQEAHVYIVQPNLPADFDADQFTAYVSEMVAMGENLYEAECEKVKKVVGKPGGRKLEELIS